MKILIISKIDKTTEVIFEDTLVWAGYIENADVLEDILSALDYDVERSDHSIDDTSLETPDEENFFSPYGEETFEPFTD